MNNIIYVGLQFDDYYAGVGGYVPRVAFESLIDANLWKEQKEHDRIFYPIKLKKPLT